MDGNTKLSRCVVQIPLVYNDGSEVEPETLIEIRSCFDRQFGGYTILGEQTGSWHGQVEPSMRVEVAVSPNDIPILRKLVMEIGHRLDQEAMYFDAPPPSVEIIPMKEYEKPGGTQRTLFNKGESKQEEGEA